MTIINDSRYAIKEIYVAPVDAEEWSEDLLGIEQINTGESYDFIDFECDYWDIMLIDEEDDACIIRHVDLCGANKNFRVTTDRLLDCEERTND